MHVRLSPLNSDVELPWVGAGHCRKLMSGFAASRHCVDCEFDINVVDHERYENNGKFGRIGNPVRLAIAPLKP
eukprot:8813006-Karenia_brevis.AAC.1